MLPESRAAAIAAELAEQIRSGELRPGDRVPSTRDLVSGYGVAMATATKALTELRHAGLVRPVPGIGTVVADPGRPGGADADDVRASGPALSGGRIVEAAIAVADAEGLPALSMRRVATDLGTTAMALYRHVDDKDDLVLQMMDAVIAEHGLPADPPDDWRSALELAARRLWAVFGRHPWLATALSLTRPQVIPGALSYTDWVLRALAAGGLDAQQAFSTYLVLFTYVRGTALSLESEHDAEAQSGLDNEQWIAAVVPALTTAVADRGLSRLGDLVEHGYDFDLDALFAFGLQRLLDGVAMLVTSDGGAGERL